MTSEINSFYANSQQTNGFAKFSWGMEMKDCCKMGKTGWS